MNSHNLLLKSAALGLAAVCNVLALHGAWYDAPQVRATVDFGYSGNYAYFMNQSEDGLARFDDLR